MEATQQNQQWNSPQRHESLQPEPTKVITVRMRKSMHDRVKAAVTRYNNANVPEDAQRVSMNVYCIQAILKRMETEDKIARPAL